LTPFKAQELSNRNKHRKSDKKRKLETNLKENDEREEKQGEVWTLEKIVTTRLQCSSLRFGERKV
jgi:hypothetical protein